MKESTKNYLMAGVTLVTGVGGQLLISTITGGKPNSASTAYKAKEMSEYWNEANRLREEGK